jgi:hypothetical protein
MAPLYGKRESQWERIVRHPQRPANRLMEATFPTASYGLGPTTRGCVSYAQ